MSSRTTSTLEAMRTQETREIDRFLEQYFQHSFSYRFNSASIRIRVIDPQFEGCSREDRDGMVEPYLDQLRPETQRDILMLLALAPSDFDRPPATFKQFMINAEFENPSRSML